MKNLSLYDNDLSVPRKQDVDGKQDQIKVKGVLEGDGTGGINAAETENAELVELTKELVGLGNVDNVKQYSATNPPPYPVTSVNGHTGTVTVPELPTVTSTDDGKFLRVVSGAWAAASVPDANGGAF